MNVLKTDLSVNYFLLKMSFSYQLDNFTDSAHHGLRICAQ